MKGFIKSERDAFKQGSHGSFSLKIDLNFKDFPHVLYLHFVPFLPFFCHLPSHSLLLSPSPLSPSVSQSVEQPESRRKRTSNELHRNHLCSYILLKTDNKEALICTPKICTQAFGRIRTLLEQSGETKQKWNSS